MNRILFALGYVWMLPTTLIGLTLALLGGATFVRVEAHGTLLFVATARGLNKLFFTGWRPTPGLSHGVAAYTCGGVIVVARMEHTTNTRLMTHELRHVWQNLWWGPLALPAYGIASAIAWLNGGDAYRDNCFERDAYEHEKKELRPR